MSEQKRRRQESQFPFVPETPLVSYHIFRYYQLLCDSLAGYAFGIALR